MAKFYVGQRVKKVCKMVSGHPSLTISPVKVPVGSEGVIIGAHRTVPDCYVVRYDNYRSEVESGNFSEPSYKLAPLTDPGADAFIEKIRQLKPLPVQEVA